MTDVDHRQLPRPAASGSRCRASGAQAVELGCKPDRRARAQPEERHRRDPARRDGRDHRKCRAPARSSLINATLYPALNRMLAPVAWSHDRRAVRRAHRARQGRQGDRDRSAADRAHAAARIPQRTPQGVRPDPRAVRRRCRRQRPTATRLAGSRSTSRRSKAAAAARRAKAPACARSRCTSCRTCSSRARSARATATTTRPCA